MPSPKKSKPDSVLTEGPESVWAALDKYHEGNTKPPADFVCLQDLQDRYKLTRSGARTFLASLQEKGVIEFVRFYKNTKYYRLTGRTGIEHK
jgi:hypothetical protein